MEKKVSSKTNKKKELEDYEIVGSLSNSVDYGRVPVSRAVETDHVKALISRQKAMLKKMEAKKDKPE